MWTQKLFARWETNWLNLASTVRWTAVDTKSAHQARNQLIKSDINCLVNNCGHKNSSPGGEPTDSIWHQLSLPGHWRRHLHAPAHTAPGRRARHQVNCCRMQLVSSVAWPVPCPQLQGCWPGGQKKTHSHFHTRSPFCQFWMRRHTLVLLKIIPMLSLNRNVKNTDWSQSPSNL